MTRAFIYARVSTEEQVSNLSLDTQVGTCKEFCQRQGWEVAAAYREEGESARTADRPELKRMLADLRRRPGLVEYVVVYDTSRFARDVYVHASLKQLLMKSGAKLRAATQPLEDSAAGRAIEGVFAVFNQLDNELRAEKVTLGMRETVARGRWPWAAPLGYRNARSNDGRKIVDFDPPRADLIRRGFELVADGVRPAEALKRVDAMGLRSRHGRRLRYADWVKLLRNPFYCGIAKSKEWGIEVQGQHPVLIDRPTWLRIQVYLGSGAQKSLAEKKLPRRKEHPDFPLRGFVRCSVCGKVLTASWSRGKTGAKYGYYRCWGRFCGAVKARSGVLEGLFVEVLERVQLAPGVVRLVEASLIELWKELREESAAATSAVRHRAHAASGAVRTERALNRRWLAP
jgi:site-specific DNA recombinase